MAAAEKGKGISWVFWLLFFLILAFVAFYFAASLRTFGEGLWDALKGYQWAFQALFLLLIAMVISKVITRLLKGEFRRIEKAGTLRIEKTRLNIVEGLLTAVIYLIALMIIINSVPELRAYSVSLVAGVGFAAIVIGFAAQETISNIIAGILIAIYQPFRVGDRIELQGRLGKVEDITLRHTVIKTWENKRLVVPNSAISKETITNFTLKDEEILMNVEMSIAYDADIDKARKIMIEEAKKHPDFFDPHASSSIIEKEEPVKVRLGDFGDSSVILKLYFWSKDYPTGFKAACDLRESIKKRFDREGVEIPFPYRTLVYKKDLEKRGKK